MSELNYQENIMQAEMTITEALAEIKTIGKRLGKKRQFVTEYLYRQDRMKDPLASVGGSAEALKSEMQSITDLELRIVRIRGAIAGANAAKTLTINGDTRSIQDWLVWRREVAAGQQSFLASLRQRIQAMRQDAAQKGLRIADGQPQDLNDIIVNISEAKLAADAEHIEEVLGVLDGKLSLLNATTTITV